MGGLTKDKDVGESNDVATSQCSRERRHSLHHTHKVAVSVYVCVCMRECDEGGLHVQYISMRASMHVHDHVHACTQLHACAYERVYNFCM